MSKVFGQVCFLVLCSCSYSSPFFTKKKRKNVTHWHSWHTVCASVSGVTEEGCHPWCVSVPCQWAGSVVREVEGVLSVFFMASLWLCVWLLCAQQVTFSLGKERAEARSRLHASTHPESVRAGCWCMLGFLFCVPHTSTYSVLEYWIQEGDAP